MSLQCDINSLYLECLSKDAVKRKMRERVVERRY